jgi:hypothetical protein
MRRIFSFVLLGVPLLLLVGSLGGAPTKDDKKDADKNTAKNIAAGEVVGKVMNIYEDKRRLRIQVTIQQPKLNQGAYNALIQAQAQYQQAAARRDVNGMTNAQRSMLQNQANLYQIESKTQDLEVTATDEAVVRTLRPKDEFDDKGRPKKFTKKELDELRGEDKKLPGYKAEFGDLTNDMIVRLQLVKKKDAPKAPVKKGKDADIDVLADNEPKASMIVILINPAAAGPARGIK